MAQARSRAGGRSHRTGLSAGSCNEAPDRFDITAPRESSRILTFGAGIHYCAGANLARAELGEALGFLARKIRTLKLDGPVELQNVSGIYGVEALPVAFTT